MMDGGTELCSANRSAQTAVIVNRHLPSVNAYADDTQLYLAFKPTGDYTNETAAASSNQPCLWNVENLMLMNKVKLNPDRTLFRILGRQQLEKVKTCTSHLTVGESRISRTRVIKKLGIMV